jgi:hypothetical protein
MLLIIVDRRSFLDETTPQSFMVAVLKQHSVLGPISTLTTDVAYFTQVLQIERLIGRLIPGPYRPDEPNESWGEARGLG